MPSPARKLDHLQEQLVDPSLPRDELWLQRARRDLERAHRAGELGPAAFHDLMCIVYGQLGDTAQAVRHGRLAVTHRPDSVAARRNLAMALVIADQTEEAVHLLEETAQSQIGPRDLAGYTILVLPYVLLGRWKSARAALAAAVACADLHNVDHLWRLMVASANAGRYEQAVEMFGRYLAARLGEPEQVVLQDPLAYVMRAFEDEDRLKVVPNIPDVVDGAIQRLVQRRNRTGMNRAVPAPNVEGRGSPNIAVTQDDAAQDDEAAAVFAAFRASRERATHAVIPHVE